MESQRHLSPTTALTATEEQIDEEMALLDEEFNMVVKDSCLLDRAANGCFEYILDSVMLGFAFEMHRNMKVGLSELNSIEPQNANQDIVNKPGLDIFGQPPMKKAPDCICPHCECKLSAARFSTHLGKCKGPGKKGSRASSRQAAKKTYGESMDTKRASSRQAAKKTNGESMDTVVTEDVDWAAGSKSQKKKGQAGGKPVKKTESPIIVNTSTCEDSTPRKVIDDLSKAAKKTNGESMDTVVTEDVDWAAGSKSQKEKGQACGKQAEKTESPIIVNTSTCEDSTPREVIDDLNHIEDQCEPMRSISPVIKLTSLWSRKKRQRLMLEEIGNLLEEEGVSINSSKDSTLPKPSTEGKMPENPAKKKKKRVNVAYHPK